MPVSTGYWGVESFIRYIFEIESVSNMILICGLTTNRGGALEELGGYL